MQHRLQPTAEQAAVIEEMMKAPYPVTIGSIAKRLGTSECDAAALLSADVAAFVAGDASARFAEVWEALADWEKVTLFIIHAGTVFEIEGKLFKGKIGHGYYNILSKHATIGGHLNYQDIGAIAFVSLPFMNRESLSVQFFTKAGDVAFAVYAGREDHKIVASVREAFFADKARFTAPVEAASDDAS